MSKSDDEINKFLIATLSAIVSDSGCITAAGVASKDSVMESADTAKALGLDALAALEDTLGDLHVAQDYAPHWTAHFGDYDEGVKYAHGNTAGEAIEALLEQYL